MSRLTTSRAPEEESIRVVRVGHGANCSSIGSLIDTLFATAVAGGAVLAAVVAALAREEVRVVGEDPGSAKNQGAAAREQTEEREPRETPDDEGRR
jgi:hypothetical protein